MPERSRGNDFEPSEVALVRVRIAGQYAEIGHRRVSSDEEVRQWLLFSSAAASIHSIGRSSDCGGCPRKWCSERVVDVEHCIESSDIWARNQELRKDDDIDMERAPLAAHLQLLDCPVMPQARLVDAVHPYVGVYEYAGCTVVVCKISESHDGFDPWSVRRHG